MRVNNSNKLSMAIAFLGAAAMPVLAQERGTLQIVTVPDSATVVLDDQTEPERQKTPYVNESMKTVDHTVLLRPADQAYMPVSYNVSIGAGQTSLLTHTFEYRTKATNMELLSIAPWKVQFGYGVQYNRYIGVESSKKLDTGAATKAATGTAPTAANVAGNLPSGRSYAPDSIPTSLVLPFEMRLGFPYGLETHFVFPMARRTEGGGATPSLSQGNVAMGLKWTVPSINSALDLGWQFGSRKRADVFATADAFTITAITSQRFKQLDVAANLGYMLRVISFDGTGLDSSKVPQSLVKIMNPGDRLFLRARAGMMFFDQVLPLLQADFDYDFADLRGSFESHPSKYMLTATPGAIWYATPKTVIEVGIPLALVASNQETHWGLRASFTYGFSLADNANAPRAAGKTGMTIPYPLPTTGVPVNAPIHIMFSGHEVTNAEYKEFCDKTGHEYPADPEFSSLPGYFSDPRFANYPVVNVSIADARAFANSVGKRLPTVTEWRKEFENMHLSGTQVACGLDAPEATNSRDQGPGMYNLVGNVAEWVENDRAGGSVAYMAGGFFSLPRERCLESGRMIDVASPAGAKYIGFRVVTEVK